jgi:cytochrome P450
MTTPHTRSEFISQETKRHPCAFYARLREQEPLCRFIDEDGIESWLVTNYDDAIAILTNPRFVNKPQREAAREKRASSQKESARKQGDTSTGFQRLRPFVAKAFTPRMIEQLHPRIQQITDELLDAVQEQGTMDLIADFAYPLPITVISELLGFPVTDRQQFRTWSQAIVNSAENPQQEATRATARKELTARIKTLLAEKRQHPDDDLTSGLLQIEESGASLSENDIVFIIFALLLAGHETTVNLIGNGMLALLQYPEQLRMLRADPSLIASAVEELLRYTGPVSLSGGRVASEDLSLHGKTIRKGEKVYIALSSANFDPHQFHEPEALDITRQQNQHLAFGKGMHYCLGAPLARLEGQIAINTLLQRLPHLHLMDDPKHLIWNRDLFLRGVTSLPVTFVEQH